LDFPNFPEPEVFSSRKQVRMGCGQWQGVQPQEPPQKRDQLVIVRGTMQTRAALESQDSSCNVDTLSPKNAEDKAVYVERTQTYVYTEMSNLVGLVTRKDLIKVTKQMVYALLLHFFSHILTYTLCFFWQQPFFGIHRILWMMLGDANLGGELWAFFTLPQVSCKSFARASLSCLASVCG
jgi:hypothetical protein